MNKSELITLLSNRTNNSKSGTQLLVNEMFDLIGELLEKGETVQVAGFGTFSTIDRAARTGRNPKTGAPVQIAASKAPKFKAGKQLKDRVNQ